MKQAQIIEFVKKNPILYDYQHPLYKDTNEKDKLWGELAAVLNADSEVLKGKWRNLRDTYAKHLKSLNEGGLVRKRYRSWQWARYMDFMKPRSDIEKTATDSNGRRSENLDDYDTDENPIAISSYKFADDSQSDSHHEKQKSSRMTVNNWEGLFEVLQDEPNKKPRSSSTVSTYKASTTKKQSQPFKKRKTDSSSYKKPRPLQNKRKVNDSALEYIFLGWAKTIKRFSPKRQLEIKMKISEIIMQQEKEHLEECIDNESSINESASILSRSGSCSSILSTP